MQKRRGRARLIKNLDKKKKVFGPGYIFMLKKKKKCRKNFKLQLLKIALLINWLKLKNHK